MGYGEEIQGHPVDAQYKGLDGKSVALVLYADQATTNEYPAAREELAAFISSKLREKIPTCKLLDYREVTIWQDDTMNWFGLTEKQIGKHFAVDRVLYIELLGLHRRHQKGPSAPSRDTSAPIAKSTRSTLPPIPPAGPPSSTSITPKTTPSTPPGTSPDALRAQPLLDKFRRGSSPTDFYDHHEFNHPGSDDH